VPPAAAVARVDDPGRDSNVLRDPEESEDLPQDRVVVAQEVLGAEDEDPVAVEVAEQVAELHAVEAAPAVGMPAQVRVDVRRVLAPSQPERLGEQGQPQRVGPDPLSSPNRTKTSCA